MIQHSQDLTAFFFVLVNAIQLQFIFLHFVSAGFPVIPRLSAAEEEGVKPWLSIKKWWVDVKIKLVC